MNKAGDELIFGTAEVLSRVFGKIGTVFRTGGDEFFVIIKDSAVSVESLESALEKEVSAWRGALVNRLSLAYGFIRGKDYPEMNIDELMIAVDREMYRHKDAYYDTSENKRRK